MAEKIELDLEKNSQYRVAYDLALTIARAEGKAGEIDTKGGRKYWLELYHQCYEVVGRGRTAEAALKQSVAKETWDPDQPA